MKISIITPIYKNKKLFDSFLTKIKEQKNQNYELILIIDTNYEDVLKVLDQQKEFFGDKLKVIFNSKRNSRIDAIKQGVRVATGDYSIIMSLSSIFHSSMVGDLLEATISQADIIEFRARLRGVVSFNGALRVKHMIPVKIEETPNVIAYSYPFDFNKLFKTRLLKNSIDIKLPVTLNSKFSIGLMYMCMLNAETYSTVDKKIVRMRIKNYNTFNPLKMIKQWEGLFEFIQVYKPNFDMEALRYAMFFSEFAITNQCVHESKSQVLQNKFNKALERQMSSEFNGILKTNRYFNNGTEEAKIVKKRVLEGEARKILKELS